jgi:hypothetical protein
MAISTQTMTPEQMKSVVIEYLRLIVQQDVVVAEGITSGADTAQIPA